MPRVHKRVPCSVCNAAIPANGRPPYLCAVCREETKVARRAVAWKRWVAKHGKVGSLAPRKCSECGLLFDRHAHQYNMLTCGKRCAKARQARQARESRNRTRNIWGKTLCARPGCGNVFMRSAAQRNQTRKYCSQRCRNEFARELGRNRARARKEQEAVEKQARRRKLAQEIQRALRGLEGEAGTHLATRTPPRSKSGHSEGSNYGQI